MKIVRMLKVRYWGCMFVGVYLSVAHYNYAAHAIVCGGKARTLVPNDSQQRAINRLLCIITVQQKANFTTTVVFLEILSREK